MTLPLSPRRLVLVGAGHAHAGILARLESFTRRGIEVTVVSPNPFWYSGMGPGLLSGRYAAADATVDVRRMVLSRGARFIDDRVTTVDADRRVVRTAGGVALPFDALSLNLGSSVPEPALAGGEGLRVFAVKPVSHFLDMRDAILDAPAVSRLRLVVLGGGAAGCEAAANAYALCRSRGLQADLRLVTAAERLLPGFPARAGAYMEAWFRERGVEVQTGRRVAGATDLFPRDEAAANGAGLVLLATGVRPEGVLSGSGLALDADGAMRVDSRLESISHAGIFGGGDGVCYEPRPLPRIGVHAVRQGAVLFANLLAALTGARARRFVPGRRHLLILNLGDGTGLAARGSVVYTGRAAFALKEWLDRRFIRRLQRAAAKAPVYPGRDGG